MTPDRISRLQNIVKTEQDRSLLNINMKSYANCRIVLFPMTFADPNPGFKCHGTFHRRMSQTFYQSVSQLMTFISGN